MVQLLAELLDGGLHRSFDLQVFIGVFDAGGDKRDGHGQGDFPVASAAHDLDVFTDGKLVNEGKVDVIGCLIDVVFQQGARPVGDAKAGVVGLGVLHGADQLAGSASGVAVDIDMLHRVQIAHGLLEVRPGGLNGQGIHGHQAALVGGRAPSGNLNLDRPDDVPAAEVDVHIASHQLHFVKIVVEQNAKVLLTPTAILQGYSLGDAVT